MAELRRQDGVTARALEFGILSAARSGEVIGARGLNSTSPGGLWIVAPRV